MEHHIEELLKYVLSHDASDLHIAAKHPPICRIHGDIVPLQVPPLKPDEAKALIMSMMNDAQKHDYIKNWEIDFAYSADKLGRYRVNAYTTHHGAAASLRHIPSEIKTLDELKTPPILRKLASLHRGIVLVTGPTGSGKSTTLASMINYLNEHYPRHIITVEDPIEFVHPSKRSLVSQREVGHHTISFERALKSALREDPDVILVGEMRDLETISLALSAAETGHLVFGTLHTSSAAKTIDRIIDVFPEGDKSMIRSMLAGSIEGVVAQQLLKRADGTGRVAAHEILIATPAIRNLIRDNKIPQILSLMQVGSKVGMVTLEDSLQKLVAAKTITQNQMFSILHATESESDLPTGTEAAFTAKKDIGSY